MIRISGNSVTPESIFNQLSLNNVQRNIVNTMATSNTRYDFASLNQLKFELDLRVSIINASRKLNSSGLAFRVFTKSFCNTNFWSRTREGGFVLKNSVSSSEAIEDIFRNGRKYGTECATAMVIIYYKAVLDIYPVELFNRMFPNIQLMNWHYLNRNLGINNYSNLPDYFPGDCRYFKNPDVNPLRLYLQGENAIDLGNGTYYAHGMGITTRDDIIRILNRNRKPGSRKSAYLMDNATHPDFKHLHSSYSSFTHS
ncbi:MAG: protein-glutamine gamma-glutamyltransferase [Tissierellales bacterium]